jgi:uncharacterized Ntn-hydrolase superfamily protein
VDTVTREVGGAGASCISNCRIINDLHINLGAIHTQALYLPANQNYARALMDSGVAPANMIDSLVLHDAANDPTIRQYGIVDLVNGGRSAGYTGENCTAWAGHVTGTTYAIQGNILLSQQIVDTMEYAFLNTPGELSRRLLAALQAAKVPGADTRCLSAGKSAISSFLKVIRVGDNPQIPYCNLVVPNTTGNTDPIDVLSGLYEDWLDTLATSADPFVSDVEIGRDTLIANGTDTTLIRIWPRNNRGQLLGPDVSFVLWTASGATISEPAFNADSSYTAILSTIFTPVSDTLTVYCLSGIRNGELADHPVIHYIEGSATLNRVSPDTYGLLEIYPNPFNGSATIRFDLPQAGEADLMLYNLAGQIVQNVLQGPMTSGEHLVRFGGESLPSGIYFLRLHTPSFTRAEKILLLK